MRHHERPSATIASTSASCSGGHTTTRDPSSPTPSAVAAGWGDGPGDAEEVPIPQVEDAALEIAALKAS